MLTEINGNIDATYPIITGELTGYLGPIGTVTASADNSVGTPHVIVTQTPTPDGLDIDFAFMEMGIPGLDLTVEQDLTEEQQQIARENIDAQEVLTFDAAPTQGSQNPVTSAGIYAADEALKDYVDDSINRSSAFFRGNFATYAALMAVPWQTTDPDAPNFVSNNDYAAVADDETHSHESWRYIYVLEEGGQDNGWTAQYRINESPFTVEQLAAINSGITANDVTKLAGIEQGAQVNTVTGVKGDAEANYRTGNINITKANIGLGNVDNTSDANKPVSTAQQAAIEAATKALYDVKSAGPAAIVSIHDAEAIPVKSLVAQITPLQDLHGYDNPWPAGGGKNLLPLSLTQIKSYNTAGAWTGDSYKHNDITYTFDTIGDLVVAIKVNGTNAQISHSSLALSAPTYKTLVQLGYSDGVDYILNGCPSGGSANRTFNLLLNAGNTSNKTDSGSGVTVTANNSDTYYFQIRVYPGYTANNLTFKPMFRLATETDPTFAPYSNICPISGWTGAKINVDGVNVWDEDWEVGSIDVDTGENLNSITNMIRSKNYIPCLPDTSYCYANGSSMYGYFFFYDANKAYISGGLAKAPNTTLDTPSNAYYMRFRIEPNYGTTYNNDISINYPSTDTSYHSGTSNTTTEVSWTDEAGTVYGGTLDVTTGVLTVKRVKEQITSFTASPSVGSAYVLIAKGVSNSAKAYNNSDISSHFVYGASAAGQFYSPNGSYFSYLFPLEYNTLEKLNTWAQAQATAGTPLEIVYELATPQTYQLTPTEVKTLLGDNNIFVDTGDVQVTYETGTVAVALAGLYEKLAAQIGA